MKIYFIAAGAGEMICGACMHDMLLAGGLLKRGNTVEMFPLYTPVKIDFDLPVREKKIYFSGISAYLEQKYKVFRSLNPGILDNLFESPSFLKMMMSFSMDVEPSKLGALTVSVLKGIEGFQRREVLRLVSAMEKKGKPDLVIITNSMLISIAPVLKERFGVPVYCQLMGEEDFLENLPAPYSEEAKSLLRKHATSVTKFLAPSPTYAAEMAYFLAVDRKQVVPIVSGINSSYYNPLPERKREPFTIGFLSRIMYAKGLDVLVEAFVLLRKKYNKNARLVVAGAILGNKKLEYFNELKARLKAEAVLQDFEYKGALDLKEKAEFLKGLSVFSVPSRFAESRGFAALEAMASGVPVVLPDSGIYRDFVNKGNAGILVKQNNAEALAEGILKIMNDPVKADEFGKNARLASLHTYSQEKMIEENVKFFEDEIMHSR
ncbi:MAG: glycosyltransferase family 4 protein [Candidatus Firestonebacteria bacterium]|nr:glycosyltransferase family 4 protein [Candidatus Firestonebacteria bacterium]